MGKMIDETGKQYGYWTVIKRLPRDTTKGGVRWLCKCKCGTEKSICGAELSLLAKERDEVKNQYCLQHTIPLIRIPYTKLGKITLEDLMPETSNFIYIGGDDFDTPCSN